MLSSRTKDEIYVFLSILVIVLIIGSFAAAANFLMQINKYIFSVDEKIIKEKTTVLDREGFARIKEKLKAKEYKPAEIIQQEENPIAGEENPAGISPENSAAPFPAIPAETPANNSDSSVSNP